jgi:hypothetical protein
MKVKYPSINESDIFLNKHRHSKSVITFLKNAYVWVDTIKMHIGKLAL